MTNNPQQETLEKNLAILLVIQNELHKLSNLDEFGFFITNETHRLIKYDFAFFWQINNFEQITIKTISGLIDVDKQTPFIQKITHSIFQYLNNTRAANTLHEVKTEEFYPPFFTEEDELNSFIVWCPFLLKNNIHAGLILFREEPWQALDLKIINWLIQSYQYTYQFLSKNKSTPVITHLLRRKNSLTISILLLLVMLIPVRLTAVGNAIIIPKDPAIIAAPFQGVIDKIEVKSGTEVKIKDLLFSLDKTELSGNVLLANKELLLTQTKLRKSIQQGYTEENETNRAEIPILEAQTKIDASRIDYYQSLLDKADVRAPMAGIVIFDNKDDWVGQPVQTGERILKIANKEKTQLAIELPVSEFIDLKVNSSGKFYPNGSIQSFPITIENISYNARLTPNKILAYRVLADLSTNIKLLRIGIEGTATLYGHYVPLIVYLFRKPLHIIRQFFGL